MLERLHEGNLGGHFSVKPLARFQIERRVTCDADTQTSKVLAILMQPVGFLRQDKRKCSTGGFEILRYGALWLRRKITAFVRRVRGGGFPFPFSATSGGNLFSYSIEGNRLKGMDTG